MEGSFEMSWQAPDGLAPSRSQSGDLKTRARRGGMAGASRSTSSGCAGASSPLARAGPGLAIRPGLACCTPARLGLPRLHLPPRFAASILQVSTASASQCRISWVWR